MQGSVALEIVPRLDFGLLFANHNERILFNLSRLLFVSLNTVVECELACQLGDLALRHLDLRGRLEDG